MGKGWVKLHRKLEEWEWSSDPNMVSLMVWLMILANYKETRYKGQIIPIGSFVTGRKSLSKKTGISEQTIRTCLERLKSTSEVTIKSTSKFSIITLCNYNTYNNDKEPPNQQIPNTLTSDQPATNQQLTTSKEFKNLKKTIDSSIILNTPPSPPKGSSVFQEEEFRDIILSVEIQQNSKLFDTLLEFYRHRKGMKAPLTKYATTKVLNKLKKISTTEAMSIEILEESIMNNWKGIFPQGSNNQAKAAPKSFKQQDADNKMAQLQKMYERRQHDEEGA